MKKVLALILSLVLCLTVCACGGSANGGNTNTGNGIDLAKALSDGKIPELDITLGTAVDSINAGEHSHEVGAESAYYLMAGEEESYYMSETAFYYYKNDKKAAGISSIVSISTAFGLTCGNFETIEDVKNAFPNVQFTEGQATAEDLYFLPYATDSCVKLTFENGNRQIIFFFEENQLTAVNMIDTANWKD